MKDLCHMLVTSVNSEQYKSTLSLKVNWSFLNILYFLNILRPCILELL